MKRRALSLLIALVALGAVASSASAAAPVWNLDVHHNQTHFPPGATAQYWFDVDNVGSVPSAGTTTVTLQLPAGLSFDSFKNDADSVNFDPKIDWECPGILPGDVTVVCKTSDPVPRHTLSRALTIEVDVDPSASGVLVATAEVKGGGAAVPATASEPTQIEDTEADFGILSDSVLADFFAADGLTPQRESGGHPDNLVVAFDFNSVAAPTSGHPDQKRESETIRDIEVNLPPGFVGDPTSVGECTPAQFTVAACPPSSQVGRADIIVYPPTNAATRYSQTTGVFNMTHPRGSVSDLGFVINGNPVHVKVGLDPSDHYAVVSRVSDINETLPPFTSSVTVWGVPGSSSHDSERCSLFSKTGASGNTDESCSTGGSSKPFITMPSQCGVAHVARVHDYDSWQNTGTFGPELDYTMPGQSTNCEKPRFEPEVEVEPTSRQANSPTGLNVHVKVAQNENPNALATPPVKSTTVTLPKGMSFSPSFSDGLQSCSLAQMSLGTNDPIACPDASRIGEVTLSTPVLPKPAEGSMYLAAQGDNPFGSLFALYLVLHDTEERGVLVKIPGRIDVDQTTGQITTTFDETPQLPFEDLTLKFRSGSRAPLVNPPSCGAQTIGVKVTSWAQPSNLLDASNTYQVNEGPNGTPCPPSPAQRPFHPKISGGTLNPSAGTYSPFVFRVSRDDSEQELSQLTATLPQGLTARIAGIPACPDSALASISSAEGTAAREAANPACPAASQIGTISAGLGAGPAPNYFPGKVYLAGPYKGAPLSMAIVTPGLAGPFDLGSVVVRAAIQVDHSTAQVTAVSDPFPTILHGVILRVRDVRVRVDRPNTTLNPTGCDPMSVDAKITGVGGDLLSTADDSQASATDRFQVGECGSLGFKPSLAFRLFGGTKRGAHPKLQATVTYPTKGVYSNIAHASVALPHSEFLDQAHIRTVCTRVQFAANSCPAGSVYGFAKATTPLFGYPVEGPVYLRSSSNPLPDLVAALKGPASQPIEVDLVGRIDSVNGGIRNTFEVVPDAPVTKFTLQLQGGKKGLLVNSRNLCASQITRATAKFTAHSGRKITLRPPMRNSCKKQGTKTSKRAAHRRNDSGISSVVSWLGSVF